MKDCGFDLNNVVGQDSVAGMSRALSGVQKIVRDKTPCGFFVSCFAHRLNLCLVEKFFR